MGCENHATRGQGRTLALDSQAFMHQNNLGRDLRSFAERQLLAQNIILVMLSQQNGSACLTGEDRYTPQKVANEVIDRTFKDEFDPEPRDPPAPRGAVPLAEDFRNFFKKYRCM
jgi:hypothetical protein